MVGKTVNKSVDRALFEITPEIQYFAGSVSYTHLTLPTT